MAAIHVHVQVNCLQKKKVLLTKSKGITQATLKFSKHWLTAARWFMVEDNLSLL